MKSTICLLLAILFTSFYTSNSRHSSEVIQYNSKVSDYYYTNLKALQEEVNQLSDLTSVATNSEDIEGLKTQITATRLRFKKIEFLFDYLHTAYSHWYINGGPIPKFNEETLQIIEPNGLQTLDELIFSDQAFNELETINSVAQSLKKKLQLITDSDYGVQIREVQIIEALRSGCVRVYTLGVTGFDTPGSVNGLEEALVSLEAMHKTFSFLEEDLNKSSKKVFKSINKRFLKGEAQLKSNSNFETFNRLTFLKEVINPLYAQLYDFQYENNITTDRAKYHAQNYKSKNLFSENFLDTNHYSQYSFLPLDNPETIKLGKLLFYDPILSSNLKMACATCHDPNKGFADGLEKSNASIKGSFTARNSPGLIDAAYASRYFWDLREYDLERQVNHVVKNNLEFNIDFDLITKRLNKSETYVKLFDSCYKGINKKVIDSRSISNAIAAYVNTLTSFNSEFDQYVRGEIKNYPKDAEEGFNLFMGKAACATCHFAPAFNGTVPPFYTETESEVLGITVGFDTINPKLDTDLGRMNNELGQEELPMFKNSFKTVTVRNAELTAPYMHNGSFKTLEDVLEFYNLGGGSGMGLNVENQTLSSEPLGLTENEKAKIIVFLKTLTDTTGLTHKPLKLPEFENNPEWNSRGTNY